jgi:drug/metabolite transporter (DMT)-like permease
MVLTWPFNLILGKVALRYLPVLAVASFRLVAAGILMLTLSWVAHSRGKSRPAEAFDRGDLGRFLLLALLGVVINQGCFVVGLNYTTVGHSALIIGMSPITILILAWYQGLEVATTRKFVGLTMAFAGVIVLAFEKGLRLHGTTVGDLITLCGSSGFALYTVQARKISSKYDSVTINTFNYGLGGLFLLPFAIYELVSITCNHGWSAVDWKGWAGLAYLTVFGSVIAFLIYTWALRYISPSRLGAFTYTHPIVSTGLGVLSLGEVITRNLVVGGVLVLTGMCLIQSGRESEPRGYEGEVCNS